MPQNMYIYKERNEKPNLPRWMKTTNPNPNLSFNVPPNTNLSFHIPPKHQSINQSITITIIRHQRPRRSRHLRYRRRDRDPRSTQPRQQVARKEATAWLGSSSSSCCPRRLPSRKDVPVLSLERGSSGRRISRLEHQLLLLLLSLALNILVALPTAGVDGILAPGKVDLVGRLVAF